MVSLAKVKVKKSGPPSADRFSFYMPNIDNIDSVRYL